MKINLKSLRIVGFLIVILFVPILILIKHYAPQSGFLGLIYFGQEFKASRMEEINNINPPTTNNAGYDGQFYAQIAMDPLLTRRDLKGALDNPLYRSRRIGLSLLAYCLGLGKPAWILQAYALLNVVFWLLLLAALGRFIGFQRPRDVLLVIAMLWSTGTLTSIERALTDFPAAVLGVLAVFFNHQWITSAFLLGGAALFKETSALSFAVALWIDKGKRLDIKRNIVSVLIMGLPITLWFIYVQVTMTAGNNTGINTFAFPFASLVHKLWKASYDFAGVFLQGPDHQQTYFASELLAPLSLVVQAMYLFVKPRFDDEAWRLGIGFVLLLCLLGSSTWVEQNGYCRILLPLTFSFNLLLHKHEQGTRFAAWYVAGNVGMGWKCFEYLKALV
ncbi:MAG TPA: hypothetical protein VJ624_03915 [Thermodesulfobacteriota bacterium]|nr:hypothetical protein [Thermodesulfobacteriota bacterium]